VERSLQGSRRRNDVPPPTIEEVHESGTGRGVLMKVNPRGIASNSWAEVVFNLMTGKRLMANVLRGKRLFRDGQTSWRANVFPMTGKRPEGQSSHYPYIETRNLYQLLPLTYVCSVLSLNINQYYTDASTHSCAMYPWLYHYSFHSYTCNDLVDCATLASYVLITPCKLAYSAFTAYMQHVPTISVEPCDSHASLGNLAIGSLDHVS